MVSVKTLPFNKRWFLHKIIMHMKEHEKMECSNEEFEFKIEVTIVSEKGLFEDIRYH